MKKISLTKLAVLSLSAALLLAPVNAQADFGDFSGDSDYGYDSWDSYDSYDSYDYSSDDSWDSYDYSSDDDWNSYDYSSDDDWDSNDYSGSGSYSSYSYSYDNSPLTMYDMFSMVIMVVVLIWIVTRITTKRNSRSGSSYRSGTAHRSASRYPSSGTARQAQTKRQEKYVAGADPIDPSLLQPMTRYASLDPDFDAAALCEMISNLYVRMQNCWTDKNIEALRPYFTDAYFTQMERQLQQLKKKGYTNHVDRIAVLGIKLKGYRQLDDTDHIYAEIRTRIVDYTVEDATKNLISGSRTAEKFMVYEWDLARDSSVKTEDQDGLRKITCPNCGAPLDINASARCEYCDSVIQLEEHDWVISSIKGLSQRTVG